MKKITKKNRAFIHELLDLTMDAHNRGLCGFFDFRGHVEWVEMRIASSINAYNSTIFNSGVIRFIHKDMAGVVKSTRKGLEFMYKNLEQKIKKAKQIEIENEKKLLAKLKSKYEKPN